MDAAMTTTNPRTTPRRKAINRQTVRVRKTPPPPAPNLANTASQPGVDPCDICEDNMPGYVIGDLAPPDQSWLLGHTATCKYCRTVLTDFERVDDLLDRLGQTFKVPVPPLSPKLHKPSAAYTCIDSPVGPLYVAVSDRGVVDISFGQGIPEDRFRELLMERGFKPVSDPKAASLVTRQLNEYFAGRRHEFDVPVDLSGISPFTKSVLTATAHVPFGQVRSYQDIARTIGQPTATRAVGNSLNRNPVPVIIPCHRIVRSDHSLGGYGGGPDKKQILLKLEGASLL
jgi:methylated-DNA-[protein]-cysteine S-methyltransferase